MSNLPDDEFKKMLKKINDDINREFQNQIDIWMGIISGEKPIGIMGSSPIKQSLNEMRKRNLITSCICCIHWKVDFERTYLFGICELSSKQISYDRTCEHWIKIGNE